MSIARINVILLNRLSLIKKSRREAIGQLFLKDTMMVARWMSNVLSGHIIIWLWKRSIILLHLISTQTLFDVYGIEYDQDFYICLEHCTCSLQDLISFFTSLNVVTSRGQFQSSIHCNMQLMKTFGSNLKLELWKANGYPSSWLLNEWGMCQVNIH